MEDKDFTILKEKQYTLLRVHTEKIDSRVSPALKAQLVMITAGGEKNIILDMSGSRYCDSSGLSAVLIGNRLCKNAGGTFVITGLQDNVRRLMSIAQLANILHITPTVDDAILFLSAGKKK